jgi:hypothetical protein
MERAACSRASRGRPLAPQSHQPAPPRTDSVHTVCNEGVPSLLFSRTATPSHNHIDLLSLKAALFFSFFFIFLIMKVFARACTDCTEGEIASLVGIIRSRLGVFLQVRAALFVEILYSLSAKSGHRLCYSRCYAALAIIDHNAPVNTSHCNPHNLVICILSCYRTECEL